MWYYGLYRSDGQFVGYINHHGIKKANGGQGSGFGVKRYVTIWKRGVNVYGGFSWPKVNKTDAIYQKTYQAKVLYHHFNGMDYYSIYDKHNHWAGYVNANAVKAGSSSMGRAIPQNRYVTVVNKNYYVYGNVNYYRSKWSSSLYYGAFHVTSQYHALNGATYLSLTDGSKRFTGIVNTSAVKNASGPQGIPIGSNQAMSVTNSHAIVWRNFSWSERASANTYRGKALVAKVHYNHVNGATYYSVYDGGKWIGYVNGGFVSFGTVATTSGSSFHKTGYAALGITFKVPTYNAPNGRKISKTFSDGQRVSITRARLIGSTMW